MAYTTITPISTTMKALSSISMAIKSLTFLSSTKLLGFRDHIIGLIKQQFESDAAVYTIVDKMSDMQVSIYVQKAEGRKDISYVALGEVDVTNDINKTKLVQRLYDADNACAITGSSDCGLTAMMFKKAQTTSDLHVTPHISDTARLIDGSNLTDPGLIGAILDTLPRQVSLSGLEGTFGSSSEQLALYASMRYVNMTEYEQTETRILYSMLKGVCISDEEYLINLNPVMDESLWTNYEDDRIDDPDALFYSVIDDFESLYYQLVRCGISLSSSTQTNMEQRAIFTSYQSMRLSGAYVCDVAKPGASLSCCVVEALLTTEQVAAIKVELESASIMLNLSINAENIIKYTFGIEEAFTASFCEMPELIKMSRGLEVGTSRHNGIIAAYKKHKKTCNPTLVTSRAQGYRVGCPTCFGVYLSEKEAALERDKQNQATGTATYASVATIKANTEKLDAMHTTENKIIKSTNFSQSDYKDTEKLANNGNMVSAVAILNKYREAYIKGNLVSGPFTNSTIDIMENKKLPDTRALITVHQDKIKKPDHKTMNIVKDVFSIPDDPVGDNLAKMVINKINKGCDLMASFDYTKILIRWLYDIQDLTSIYVTVPDCVYDDPKWFLARTSTQYECKSSDSTTINSPKTAAVISRMIDALLLWRLHIFAYDTSYGDRPNQTDALIKTITKKYKLNKNVREALERQSIFSMTCDRAPRECSSSDKRFYVKLTKDTLLEGFGTSGELKELTGPDREAFREKEIISTGAKECRAKQEAKHSFNSNKDKEKGHSSKPQRKTYND